MKKLFLTAMLIFAAINVDAQPNTKMEGSHWVQFQPMQSNGVLNGCSLVFLTVVKDVRYKNGNHTALNGSINFNRVKNNLGMSFKIGVKDINENTPFERPVFAYIQTKNATTAKSVISKFDGDPGYSFYVYNAADKEIIQVVSDLLENANIQIGYNFKEGGLDVLAPIDLFVVDSKMDSETKVTRKTSPDVAIAFGECIGKVISGVEKDLK
jgi:hypothetical protein